MTRRPASYARAELRCVLPVDPADPRLSVAFDLADGQVLRLHVGEESARGLLLGLQRYWPHLMVAAPSVPQAGPPPFTQHQEAA